MPGRCFLLQVAIVGLCQGWPAGDLLAEPYRPDRDDVVLERLPEVKDSVLRALADRQAALAEDPRNLPLAIDIAKDYAELGRSRGDPRYEGYARATLVPWWNLDNPPIAVRLLRAHLHQRRHDFNAALIDLDAVLKHQPDNPQAWLSKAMVHAVRGEPEAASSACGKLSGATLPVVAVGCHAHVGRLTGKAGQSYRLLKETLAEQKDAAPELRLWLLTIMAEIAIQMDWNEQAERHLEDALTLDDQDPYVLGAYADFLLDRDRPAEVVDLLDGRSLGDPLLLRLAIAEMRVKAPRAGEHIDLLRARFDDAARRLDSVHLREQSRFTLVILDQPARALDLALANWKTQRERADADLVLSAAIASGRTAAAAPVLDWIAATGIEDARLRGLASRLQGASS